jgi:glutathione peroxidase
MSLHDHTATTLDGGPANLADYKGQVVLVVNVASKCGLTPQYEGLEALHRRHKDEGFTVLGFPCNQFAGQEPGTAEEIASFCSLNYDVTFPLMAKVDVNGPNAHPLWTELTAGEPVAWNFAKFLIGRDGQVIERFGPRTTPDEIEPAVAKALAQ